MIISNRLYHQAFLGAALLLAAIAGAAGQSATAPLPVRPAPGAAVCGATCCPLPQTVPVSNLLAGYGSEIPSLCGHHDPAWYTEQHVNQTEKKARCLSSHDWASALIAQAQVYHNATTGRPTADVLIFIHGYSEGLRRTSTRIRALRDDLYATGYRGGVGAWVWPSPRIGVPLTYPRDYHVAEETGHRLVTECIDPLHSAAPPGLDLRIHLLAHSLGATYVRAAFAGLPPCHTARPRVENVFIFGGDVATSCHGESPCPDMCGLAAQSRQVVSYFCAQDDLLHLSEAIRLCTEPRLGLGGLSPCLRAAGAIEIDGTLRYAQLNNKALGERWTAQVQADDLRTRGVARPRYTPLNPLLRILGAEDGPEPLFPSHEWYFQDPAIHMDLRLRMQQDHRPHTGS